MPIKKVAFIVKYFPTVSETFIVNQINSLFDAGYEVELFAYQKVEITVIQDSLKTHDLLKKVNYFIKAPESKIKRFLVFVGWIIKHFFSIKWPLLFKSINGFKYGKDAYTLKLFFEAQWFLLPHDFTIIHVHFGMNGNRIAFLKKTGILSKEVKLINTFHGYDLIPNKIEKYRKAYSYLLEHSDAFTVNTKYLEGLFNKINDYNKPCHILPVGLDTTFFTRIDQTKESKYFDLIFCGKLIALKGPDIAIQTVKKLHQLGHTQVRLHIIGQGEMKMELKQFVEESQLENSVSFYGAQKQAELKQHLNRGDAFILPGRYEENTQRAETQGLVIQEAQAMELPVIISDVGGMKYGMIPNESGYVVKEGDVVDFANAVIELLVNSNLKKDMGIKGRLFAEQYDSKVLVKKLIKIYEGTI